MRNAPPKKRWIQGILSCLVASALAGAAHAGQIGRDADLLRTGWYPDQPGLSPDVVSRPAFGQLFSTPVTGQVFAQPLVFDGTLLIGTQSNWIYGLDPISGAVLWSRSVGTPWNASDVTDCMDIFPVVGITATPVIDDATGIAYFTCKRYEHGNSGTVIFQMHAVSVATGAEQTGFPVTLDGVADNDPSQTFNAATQNQRPGLLLLDGVIYAAFGSVCDIMPYQGWVMGVSTAGAVTARWVDRTGGNSGCGVWMAGSGLVSDAPGQILFVTGNGLGGGTPDTPTPGNNPPADLGESVVRLSVQPDGSLLPTDFFTPTDAGVLYDPIDLDVGSGGVVGLPYPPFGTPAYPRLLAEIGKPGYIYLMDAGALGGYQQGPDTTDLVVQEVNAGGGVWSKPAIWGGDGGWFYVPTADTTNSDPASYGYVLAFQAAVDGSGKPTLTLAGKSADPFGFSSSCPIVTSYGTTSGSALVWIVQNPDSSGNGAVLRAYDAVPVNGTLQPRFSAPVGQGSKFVAPGVSGGRLYYGTRDGHVLCFGLAASGVSVAGGSAPAGRTRLGLAYPNPFAGTTTLELALARSGPVRLTVFDPRGRRVRRLIAGDLAAGTQRVVWDGRDEAGARVPTGLYLVRMDAAGTRQTRRVMVVR